MKRFVSPILLAGLAAAAGARGMQVKQQIWGFGGKVVPGRINPLYVEVENEGPDAFEGEFDLHKSLPLGARRGARLVRTRYLRPHETAWLRFYPYILHESEEWALRWSGPSSDSVTLRSPRAGPPARVILQDPSDRFAKPASFRGFWDDHFPPTVAATDGLHSVVLDHAPRWDPNQKTAFLDWLRRGGHAHVLHGRNGRYPVFAETLAVLNASLERQPVGAGVIHRHPLTRRQLSASFRPDPVPRPGDQAEAQEYSDALTAQGHPVPQLMPDQELQAPNLERRLFHRLRGMTRPEHNWPLIYLCTIAYIVLIGPVNYLFGRKQRDYRLTLLFFFVTVAGFAWLLSFLGRRGHGEATAIHSLTYAHHLGGNDYDCTQWVNAFVTRGARYPITHAAPYDAHYNLYSTCLDVEAVSGTIRNGKDGAFAVNIPLFSSRPFLHRAKLRGPAIRLRVVAWQGSAQLQRLVLAPGPDFPKDVQEMWVRHRGVFYPLARRQHLLEARVRSGESADQFLGENAHELFGTTPWGAPWPADDEDDEEPVERRFARLYRPLIAHAVGGAGRLDPTIVHPPGRADHVQVFLYARAPESFRIQGGRFGKRIAFVLYHVDLFHDAGS